MRGGKPALLLMLSLGFVCRSDKIRVAGKEVVFTAVLDGLSGDSGPAVGTSACCLGQLSCDILSAKINLIADYLGHKRQGSSGVVCSQSSQGVLCDTSGPSQTKSGCFYQLSDKFKFTNAANGRLFIEECRLGLVTNPHNRKGLYAFRGKTYGDSEDFFGR